MDENDANAPLDLIRSKERQLAQLIKDAENRAKEKLAAARARAKAIRQEAEISGQREAEGFYRHELSLLQQAAAVIPDASAREAEQLNRSGEKHLDRAVGIAIDFIFPK